MNFIKQCIGDSVKRPVVGCILGRCGTGKTQILKQFAAAAVEARRPFAHYLREVPKCERDPVPFDLVMVDDAFSMPERLYLGSRLYAVQYATSIHPGAGVDFFIITRGMDKAGLHHLFFKFGPNREMCFNDFWSDYKQLTENTKYGWVVYWPRTNEVVGHEL